MYCSIDDIAGAITRAELVNLSDDINSKDINEELINNIIQNNTDLINGYIRGKYSVPLINNTTKTICVNLSIYELRKRRETNDEEYRSYYDDSITLLESIADGTINFNTTETSKHIHVKNTSEQGVFSNAFRTFRGMKV